jgi:ribonucleoside-triphosphate reductase
MFEAKENGDKLSTIEAHDMICHIADAVLAGGIRRAALISLFSADDNEMIAAKTGNWWETAPQTRQSKTTLLYFSAIESPKNTSKICGKE